MAFAYRDMSYEEFQTLKEECNNFKEESDREALETQLTFVSAIALKDDLRENVLRSIQYA